jgi:hypothetical protein
VTAPEADREGREPPERPAATDEEALERAAEADETLPPGSMPGGPEYPEEATEGRDRPPRG